MKKKKKLENEIKTEWENRKLFTVDRAKSLLADARDNHSGWVYFVDMLTGKVHGVSGVGLIERETTFKGYKVPDRNMISLVVGEQNKTNFAKETLDNINLSLEQAKEKDLPLDPEIAINNSNKDLFVVIGYDYDTDGGLSIFLLPEWGGRFVYKTGVPDGPVTYKEILKQVSEDRDGDILSPIDKTPHTC